MKKMLILPAVLAAFIFAPGLASAQYYGQQYAPYYGSNYGYTGGYQSAVYNPQYSYNPYQSYGQFGGGSPYTGYGYPYTGYGYGGYGSNYGVYGSSYGSGYNPPTPYPPAPGSISTSVFGPGGGLINGWMPNTATTMGYYLCYGGYGNQYITTPQQETLIQCQMSGGIAVPTWQQI